MACEGGLLRRKSASTQAQAFESRPVKATRVSRSKRESRGSRPAMRCTGRLGTVLPLEDARVAQEMLECAPHKRGRIVLRVAAMIHGSMNYIDIWVRQRRGRIFLCMLLAGRP